MSVDRALRGALEYGGDCQTWSIWTETTDLLGGLTGEFSCKVVVEVTFSESRLNATTTAEDLGDKNYWLFRWPFPPKVRSEARGSRRKHILRFTVATRRRGLSPRKPLGQRLAHVPAVQISTSDLCPSAVEPLFSFPVSTARLPTFSLQSTANQLD